LSAGCSLLICIGEGNLILESVGLMQDLATVDTILLNELPAVENREAVSACS
jgi:hypothetical protein